MALENLTAYENWGMFLFGGASLAAGYFMCKEHRSVSKIRRLRRAAVSISSSLDIYSLKLLDSIWEALVELRKHESDSDRGGPVDIEEFSVRELRVDIKALPFELVNLLKVFEANTLISNKIITKESMMQGEVSLIAKKALQLAYERGIEAWELSRQFKVLACIAITPEQLEIEGYWAELSAKVY